MTETSEEKITKSKPKLGNIKLNQFILGLAVGILLVFAIRFITYQPEKHVHHHANYAVYLEGQREKFESPFYYEEVTACDLDSEQDPAHRTHMHESINDLVHVHDGGVTWGNFFQNIGWNIGKGYIDNGKKLYQNDAFNKVSYVLNGQPVDNVTNRLIGSEDKLLVSYGNDDQAGLDSQYQSISSSAKEANTKQDPASCSGSDEQIKLSDRLKNIF